MSTQNQLFDHIDDFYPTPRHLIIKMLSAVKMSEVVDILEPSAGKGHICDYIKELYSSGYSEHKRKRIDVIEIDPDLQMILKQKEYRLIHDDFLTFSGRKRYDLIIANFPFSQGADHLLHALDHLERNGGRLVCLVNAETIRNRNSGKRELCFRRLEAFNAKIEFLSDQFLSAERSTKVEVALIDVSHDRTTAGPSILIDHLEKSDVLVPDDQASSGQLVSHDFLTALLTRFDLECRAGIILIEEYFSLKPYMMDRIKRDSDSYNYSSPILKLSINGKDRESKSDTINRYLEGIRHKYWEVLIRDPRFNANYTSNILKDLESKLADLRHYDFTRFNIHELEKEMRSKIIGGIEASIIDLFDRFSRKFAWDESIANGNLHYYNGWKSNKAHRINQKIIQPMNGCFASYTTKMRLDYHIRETLLDMVKVFNYLAADRADVPQIVGRAIQLADDQMKFRAMDLRYFETTFYKKGTCHIKFVDPDLLEKFNIFGSQRKGWLPPAYGKKPYDAMTVEEQIVIDEFQGREAYEKVMLRPDYFLVESSQLMIEGGESNDS